jgi:ATP-dependent Lon protease
MLDTIPQALRDRMEIITFPGYTEGEKFQIAKKFLWDKQIVSNGLKGKKITIADSALKELINKYTREAGVRSLERNIAKVMRKTARLIAEKKKYPKKLSTNDVYKFLWIFFLLCNKPCREEKISKKAFDQ